MAIPDNFITFLVSIFIGGVFLSLYDKKPLVGVLQKEISNTHIFLSEGILRIKGIVSLLLSGNVGSNIGASSGNTNAQIKSDILI